MYRSSVNWQKPFGTAETGDRPEEGRDLKKSSPVGRIASTVGFPASSSEFLDFGCWKTQNCVTVKKEMRSRNKIWTLAGVLLLGALVSLSICINSCTDIAPVSDACPHHQESSDCCKHSSGDVAALSWNTQKQQPLIISAVSADWI